MADGYGEIGALARVTGRSDDEGRIFLELRNGNNGWFESLDGETYSDGEVVLITEGDHGKSIERMPDEVWPEEEWVGVVKIKLPDVTIIESGGRNKTVPTNSDLEYEVSNTVHATDLGGVTRVLSKEPIKLIDLPEVDDSTIEQFRWNGAAGGSLDFDDFGGMPGVVPRARELIEVPLAKHTELAAIGARPIKGVLFTGAPGTGKTLLARIIAAKSGAEFYEISGPQIFSKRYGQSEELLRRLFGAAAKHDRAIIFFDEIDSVAGQRDDDAHEASKRVVAQLLTLMDGFSADSNVIVIATTNRPQDLDVALRRPGRFDWEIEFPFPEEADRCDIFMTTARGKRLAESLPHEVVASSTEGWSAAELAAVWAEATLLAVADDRDSIAVEDYIGGFERVARQRTRVGSSRSTGSLR